MDKTKMTILGFAMTALASLAIVVSAVAGRVADPAPAAADNQLKTLTIDYAVGVAAGLHDGEGTATYTPIDYSMDSYDTLRFVHTSLKEQQPYPYIRLNPDDEYQSPSYIEKIEPCYGMTEITVTLNYGYADILTGYEPGVFTNRYIIRPATAQIGSSITKTIPVEGNYFRIENLHNSKPALLYSLTVTYGCTTASKVSEPAAAGYDMEEAVNDDTVRAGAGHWFYHSNGGYQIDTNPAPRFENRGFTSTINVDSAETEGARYYYQPEVISGLGNEYRFHLEVRLSVAAEISEMGGQAAQELPANEWVPWHTYSFIFSESSTPNFVAIKPDYRGLPSSGTIQVEIRNIVIARLIVGE